MTETTSLDDAQCFGDYWDHYQKLYAHPKSRALHAVGTAAAIGILVLAVARRSTKLALLAPLVDAAISHNSRRMGYVRPRPLRRAWWHARAEWRLFRNTIEDAERDLHDRW